MSVQTELYPLETELNLTVKDTPSSLTVQAMSLAVTKENDKLIECRLTFSVNSELYQRINKQELFNLTPDNRIPLSEVEFLPEIDIVIESSLKPDFLPHLTEKTTNIDETATYLQSLSQNQPYSPILSTENWFALSVKQQQESGEIGYRTVWSYVSPTAFSDEESFSEEISEGLTNFFQDMVSSSLDSVAKEFSDDTVETISNLFQEVAENIPDLTVQDTSTQPIFQAVINFFTEDNWTFTRIQGEFGLRLRFAGNNGTWNCYAKVREEQEQFAFYSICPILTPESQRAAMAEFITRANYGVNNPPLNRSTDFNGGLKYSPS